MPKTALIIGGTSGLGLSLAWGAHNRGIQPTIAGRSVNDPEVGMSFPPDASWLELNLANPASVERLGGRRTQRMDYIFWVAGNFSRQPLSKMSPERIVDMTAVHWSGPIRVLQLLHRHSHTLKHPYHLVTIASTSSWRMRNDESIYCALKAAKAHFTRNFARELARDLPGSKVTLVNPGGIKTNLFSGTDQDISKFMDSSEVAKIIWNEIDQQVTSFKEVQIMRNEDGSPNVSYGPRLPEPPFGEIVIPEDLKDKGILSEEQSNRVREALGFEGDL